MLRFTRASGMPQTKKGATWAPKKGTMTARMAERAPSGRRWSPRGRRESGSWWGRRRKCSARLPADQSAAHRRSSADAAPENGPAEVEVVVLVVLELFCPVLSSLLFELWYHRTVVCLAFESWRWLPVKRSASLRRWESTPQKRPVHKKGQSKMKVLTGSNHRSGRRSGQLN